MKYTKTKLKKPYTSPELSIHELGFEGALLDVSAGGSGMPWDAPRFKKINNDVIDEEEYLDDEASGWNNFNVNPVK